MRRIAGAPGWIAVEVAALTAATAERGCVTACDARLSTGARHAGACHTGATTGAGQGRLQQDAAVDGTHLLDENVDNPMVLSAITVEQLYGKAGRTLRWVLR